MLMQKKDPYLMLKGEKDVLTSDLEKITRSKLEIEIKVFLAKRGRQEYNFFIFYLFFCVCGANLNGFSKLPSRSDLHTTHHAKT